MGVRLPLFFRSAIVIGEREVEARLLSASVVIREVIGKRLARVAEAFDAARLELVPKVTGRAASSLFSEIRYESRPVRRIYMKAGYHADVAPYVGFLDFGSGIHHVPDPHPPWVQTVKRRQVRLFQHINPGVEPFGTMGGLLETHVPAGPQHVIHYGQRPMLFTEKALEMIRPIYTAQMRTAGPEIARRLG